MSTPKRFACKARRNVSGDLGSAGTRPAQRGFTLIELLVVVAIIALLLSILLPGLQGARESARTVVCGQRLHDFAIGLGSYTAENQEWFPGVNTSGVAVRALELLWGGDVSILYQQNMPVQSWDWMTPLLAHQMELPPVRAEKFRFLLDEMRCPTQKYTAQIYQDGPTPPDIDAFDDGRAYPAVSFLSPVHFQYVGQSHGGKVLAYKDHPAVSGRPVSALAAPEDWECISEDYLPRLDRVGQPSGKIFVADGTRYLDVSDGSDDLDFDVYPGRDQSPFGSFATAGAWWCGSPAYGVEQGTTNWDGDSVSAGEWPKGRGRNLALSYRHGIRGTSITSSAQSNKGMINALFFDGHVGRLNDKQSRNITYWYPRGSVVQEPSEGMTEIPMGFVVP